MEAMAALRRSEEAHTVSTTNEEGCLSGVRVGVHFTLSLGSLTGGTLLLRQERSLQGRILKHIGDLVAAAALADEARCMDLADCYVNSECVELMLEADQVALAKKTSVLFTKEVDQHNNLHDMQCMWYELASGESYFHQGDLGRALKKFLAVEKHYVDITEDQFDFHSYCLRKMTLRTYVEMLKFQDRPHSHEYFCKATAEAIYVEMMKFQDRLHSHEYFCKAVAGAIRCYIKLYDSPPKSSAEEDDEISKLPARRRK